jgi:hypothetical protein
MEQRAALRLSTHVPCLVTGEDLRGNLLNGAFAGTAFGCIRRGIFLTAQHCVKGRTADQILICKYVSDVPAYVVGQVWHHPTADVSVMALAPGQEHDFEWFRMLRPEEELGLGAEVCAYGYPVFDLAARPVELTPRVLTGTMQRAYDYADKAYKYVAAELSFAVTEGMSGAPVLLKKDGKCAVGIIAGNQEWGTVVDHWEEDLGPQGKESHTVSRIITYGRALWISNHRDWLLTCLGEAERDEG